jgi:hypothetical protein
MMLVVTPRRRATAQGLGLLASHLLGDAASPVLIGMVVVSLSPISQSEYINSLCLTQCLGPGRF